MTKTRPLAAWTDWRPLAAFIDTDSHNNFRLIRLIAAIMIVEGHSHLSLAGENDYFDRFHISNLGLPLFFFLSGLLVTQSLYNSSSWKNFLWKRMLRIYPAAIVSVLATALLMGPLVTELPIKEYFSSPQLYKNTFITCTLLKTDLVLPGVFTHSAMGTPHANVSLWTIRMELKLYLALLLLSPLTFTWKKRLLPVLFLLLVGYYFSKGGVVPTGRLPWFTYGAQFITGAICFHFKDRIFISSYILFLLPSLCYLSFRLDIWIYTAYLLIPALVICAGTFAVGYISKITPKADLSYGIYVFAFPVQQLIANYLHPASPLQFFILSLIAVCPLALFSWYVVEKNALRLKGLVK